uniref:Uncharacterized protein n=1 Tax=Stegastes partitus TaxID=144197 RepID=A0A3B5A4E0_9TELE
MSTSGANAGKIVIAASSCSTWDDYVAGAVMTYYPVMSKKEYFDGTIKIPDYVRCQAFNLKSGGKMNPCKSCGNLFGLTGLEDTIYRGKHDEVNRWEKCLQKLVNRQVVGVVEGTSCHCDQLVLMTCEDKKLYAYDGEELHLVASSLERLGDKEIEYPASKSYYNGEAFDDMVRGYRMHHFLKNNSKQCVKH